MTIQAQHVSFGTISINGANYDHDVIINGEKIKNHQNLIKKQFGHTPLSIHEDIPWNGSLIIDTGASGRLPVMENVYEETERQDVE